MTKLAITQSEKRFSESLAAKFSPGPLPGLKDFLFLTSSSDQGVIRNGGRNGARYAPQALLSAFKKLTWDQGNQNYLFTQVEVSSPTEEEQNFQQAQELEAKRIAGVLQKNGDRRICHLGGGHDHLYPLIQALASDYSRLVLINIDAHADTRTDEQFHSGTPIRQIARSFKGDFHVFQIGLHPFANSSSTLTKLERGHMHILWKHSLDQPTGGLQDFFSPIKALITKETLVVFSLDADAIDGSQVPGVSAVNPDGLTLTQIRYCWDQYQALGFSHAPVLGIYELNPVYDTLAGISMRAMASFIYSTLN